MAHGTSKGKIHPEFAARITELEEKAERMAKQFRDGSDFRPWHTPKDNKSLLDVPTMHMPAWDRYEINKAYAADILAGPGRQGGTCGDLIATKTQADFMAVEERAFRTRHASYVRCAALMHGQVAGHGQPGKSVFSFLQRSLKTIIDDGAVTK
jgi:hypothetical protein